MSYTGNVSPGSPPDTRELAALTITKVSVGPMDNNAYLLRCTATGEQLLIDAANETDRLLSLIGDSGLSTVVTTHRHRDHWMALSMWCQPPARPPSRTVAEGETVPVGDCALEVIHLIGHTPGSIALLYHDPSPGGIPHLFTGDSLFPGGVGNTSGDAARFTSLLDDVSAKLFDRLPDETWFYPGHGKDSTLGAERGSLPEWRARGW